jgi:hypothetical protein
MLGRGGRTMAEDLTPRWVPPWWLLPTAVIATVILALCIWVLTKYDGHNFSGPADHSRTVPVQD